MSVVAERFETINWNRFPKVAVQVEMLRSGLAGPQGGLLSSKPASVIIISL